MKFDPKDAIFFATPLDFRKWLERNHKKKTEQWVGFYKKNSGKPSITWPESVDAALSFGWIDGIRKNIDDSSYAIRFTPRRPRSNWSAINVERIKFLTERKLMHPSGFEAFQSRVQEKTAVYTYEQRHQIKLDEAYEQTFQANKKAWDFFQNQASSYKKLCFFYVMGAKQEETRKKRLTRLIETSAKGKRL